MTLNIKYDAIMQRCIYFEPSNQNKSLGVMAPIHHSMMSLQPNDTKFKIYCHYAQGEGAYQSVTYNKGRGSQGVGTVMSHPSQEGVGGRDQSPFPKRGGGIVMSHPFERGVG